MAQNKNKTQPTDVPVADYLAAIPNEARRKDCEAVAALMAKITKAKPRMWGPSIVGFDSVHYTYDSGREGDMGTTGFSSRKEALVLYVVADGKNHEALLAKLGKHKAGKCCLYIKKLADVDLGILEQLITESVAETNRRYPKTAPPTSRKSK